MMVRFLVFSAVFWMAGLSGIPKVSAGTFVVRHEEGETVIQRAGESSWQPLRKGEKFHLGDRIVSSEGGLLQIESSLGVLEMSDGTDLLLRSEGGNDGVWQVTLELASGRLKGDWTSDRLSPLIVRVPGGEFTVENGFFSLWIYSLLGQTHTRADLFRGEGFMQETYGNVPLAIMAGQHMTTGLEGGQGPRETPVIPGFDTFEIDPHRDKGHSSLAMPEANAAASSTSTHV